MSSYDPVCRVCRMRPVMDRCDICEECWYAPRRTGYPSGRGCTCADPVYLPDPRCPECRREHRRAADMIGYGQ